MKAGFERLAYDPIPALMASGERALIYFVQRDLLGEKIGSGQFQLKIPEVVHLIKKQSVDGSWKYHGSGPQRHPYTNYNLLETFRSMSILVSKYQLTMDHPAIQNAAEYVFRCQHREGDIRGILGAQYMPYYLAVILEQLILAGYGDDPRVLKGIEWLESVQQADGGWLIPAQSVPPDEKTDKFWVGHPLLADRNLPSSHLCTGMVLRVFAVHPGFRKKSCARRAAQFISSRFFKPDYYNERKASVYWIKYQFPFWWLNLLTALDSFSLMGFPVEAENIQLGLDWFADHQEPDGLWPTGYDKGRKAIENRNWVGLAVCRMLRRFSGKR